MRRGLLLVLSLLGCSREPGKESDRKVETGSVAAATPTVVTAETTTVEVPLELPSQLYVEHDATVYARSTGIVQSILVDLGSRVAAGQPLARLESTDQEIALAQAQEKFTNTKLTLDRQRSLRAAGVVTQADSERVEFEHREAGLALRQAQRDLELTRITAPFAGVVTSRAARIHRMVNQGDSLFRITALRPILAAVRVPEQSASGIRIGARAEIVGSNGATAEAKVVRASPVLDPGSGTRELVLELTGQPALTPGSNVTVRLGLERRRVVAIPRSAVAEDGYALIWSNDKTVLRQVTLGSMIGDDLVEIVNGLAPGEKVIPSAP